MGNNTTPHSEAQPGDVISSQSKGQMAGQSWLLQGAHGLGADNYFVCFIVWALNMLRRSPLIPGLYTDGHFKFQ